MGGISKVSGGVFGPLNTWPRIQVPETDSNYIRGLCSVPNPGLENGFAQEEIPSIPQGSLVECLSLKPLCGVKCLSLGWCQRNTARLLMLGSVLLDSVKTTPLLLAHSFLGWAPSNNWMAFLAQHSCYHQVFSKLSSSYLDQAFFFF